ncbi:MAG: adenosylcobinamide-GDP ribazoletransferase, partial [Chloroflexi bacterium]|nr:adenosylcobinamide-GDP ribazoletransferase [Chloroflexota bacterium]
MTGQTSPTSDGAVAAPEPVLPAKPQLRFVRALLLAASFLTSVPVPRATVVDDATLAGSIRFFPLVGAAIGTGAALVDLTLSRVLPPSIVSVFDIATLALLSGGLHLDALMDTCDGVFGGTTVERRLTIMKDSRIGSFGVTGGVLTLLVQFAALEFLTTPTRWLALIAVGAASRWSMTLGIAAFPSARPSGLGASFRRVAKREPVVTGTVMALLLVSLLNWQGLLLLPFGIVVVLASGTFLVRQLGGLTGDSYGTI